MVIEFGNRAEESPMNSEKALGIGFELRVANEAGQEAPVWSSHARYEGSMPRAAIFECESAVAIVEYTLGAVGIPRPHERINLMMSVAGSEQEPVWPAFSQISHQIDRFAESPHKYLRPPKIITLQFIRAMMRSHFAVLAQEAAEAESKVARAELNVLEVAAGMHEPSYYD